MLDALKDRGIVWQDGFLSAATIDGLLEELDHAFWKPSTVVRQQAGTLVSEISRGRVSETAEQVWFSDPLLGELAEIERSIEDRLRCDRSHFEPWQATRYGFGGKFSYHLDCGYWGDEAAGEREKTVLLYLTTPDSGGSTYFRELDLEVEAKAGRLLIWNNLLPSGECDPRMLHASEPVTEGQKITLLTWIRQRAIRGEATREETT